MDALRRMGEAAMRGDYRRMLDRHVGQAYRRAKERERRRRLERLQRLWRRG